MTTLISPLFTAADASDVLSELRQLDNDLLENIGAELERALNGDLDAVRIYVSHCRTLSCHVAREAELEWTDVLIDLLTNAASDVPFLPWTAHFDLGDAVGLGLTSRARELLGSEPLARDEGAPHLLVEVAFAHRFIERVRYFLSHPDDEEPLQRLIRALDLSKTELGGLFGVSRQAVDRWRRDGVPADRQEKLSALLALVDLLERKLKPGRLPGVARRPAPAYDGGTMLDLIRHDRHGELLESTRASFAWHVSAQMAYGESISRGGVHYRIALPHWADALDTSYSQAAGGRWNAAGSFGALYLNDSVPLARLQANHKLAGLPYGAEDLDPTAQHDLVIVDVPQLEVLDCATDSGLKSVGLPESYPDDGSGSEVPWSTCQPIGAAAYADGPAGIACRSAATGAAESDEELAVFDTHSGAIAQSDRLLFDDWYW